MSEPLIHCEPLAHASGRITGVMTMRLDHPAAAVWSVLTEPRHLVNWLAPGEVELKVGGAVKLDFEQSGVTIDSQIAALTPERALEYSWSAPGEPHRPLAWSVESRDDGALLILKVEVPDTEDAARGCAGWAAHLEMLAATLEGTPIKFPFESFKAQREAYRAQLASV